jgi:HEAT repeat protein/Uri superfamily endonuclease
MLNVPMPVPAAPVQAFQRSNVPTVGIYVLALQLDRPQPIRVGRLGDIRFPAGWYLYVGSARGPGGLQARLARHRRCLGPKKQAHWHVDYLREQAIWGGAWGRVSDERLECAWAARLRGLPGAENVAPGFGASDCRCPGHLVRVSALPGAGWFLETLGAQRLVVADEQLDKLLQILETDNDAAREEAALALGGIGGAAREHLVAMLSRPDADARWWAARALAEVGGSQAVLALVRALNDPDADVRACVALALGRIGDGQAAPALAACLGDGSTFVADIAADALAMLGEVALEALVAALDAPDPHVRLLAVRTLGRINSKQAIQPLCSVLDDSSYLVRYYAQEALEALGEGMIFFAP